MKWKAKLIDYFKPVSFSAHFWCGAFFPLAGSLFWPHPIVWAGIAVGVGILLEAAYYGLRSADALHGSITFTDRGWPKCPANSWVQITKVTPMKLEESPQLPPDLKAIADKAGGFINKPDLFLVRAFIWRHADIDRRLPSKRDLIPWVLGAALGAAVVLWRG